MMSTGVENSSQSHDSSTETSELMPNQEIQMDNCETEFSSSEVTQYSVSAPIKLAIDPIVKQVEDCVRISKEERTELSWKQRSYRLLSA